MSNVILCNLSDAQKIIEEERLYWVNEVLDALGVPEETYNVSTIEEFRINMDTIGVDVELGSGGEVKVYKLEWHEDGLQEGWLPRTNDHLVAHWKEPRRVRRIDGINVYYEIHLNEWSVLNMRENK
jgi:hypothetical protein